MAGTPSAFGRAAVAPVAPPLGAVYGPMHDDHRVALARPVVGGEEDAGVQLRPVVRREPLVACRRSRPGPRAAAAGAARSEEGGERGEQQAHEGPNARCVAGIACARASRERARTARSLAYCRGFARRPASVAAFVPASVRVILAALLAIALCAGVALPTSAQDPRRAARPGRRRAGAANSDSPPTSAASTRSPRRSRSSSTTLEQRRAEVQADLDRDKAKLAAVQEELRAERARLARLRARLDEARTVLAERLLTRYKASDVDVVSVVLNASSFSNLLERAEFLKRIQQNDEEIVVTVRDARADAIEETKRLEAAERAPGGDRRARSPRAATRSPRWSRPSPRGARRSRASAPPGPPRSPRPARTASGVESRLRAVGGRDGAAPRALGSSERAAGRSRGRSCSASPAARTCRPTPRARRATTSSCRRPGRASAGTGPHAYLRPKAEQDALAATAVGRRPRRAQLGLRRASWTSRRRASFSERARWRFHAPDDPRPHGRRAARARRRHDRPRRHLLADARTPRPRSRSTGRRSPPSSTSA